jgi:hypothetical protein
MLEKKLQLIVFCLLITIFSSTVLSAQTKAGEAKKIKKSDEEKLIEQLKQKPLRGFFGISFTNSVPQGEFQDNFHKSGQGFSAFGGYFFDPLPIALGLNGDILFYGSQERHGRYNYADPYGIYHTYYDTASTQNMVIPISVFARFQPNVNNFILPYAELNVGLSVLTTSYDYKSSLNINGTTYNDDQSNTSVSFNYGIGAGVMIKLFEFIELPSTIFSMTLDIRMKYIKGTEATYFRGNFTSDNKYELKEMKSQTDLFLTQAGFTFRF